MALTRLSSFNPNPTAAQLMAQQAAESSTLTKAAMNSVAQNTLGQAREDVLRGEQGAVPQFNLAQSVANAVHPDGVTDYRNVHGVGDALSYAANAVGGSIPYMLPSIVGAGLLSPLGGGAVAKTALGMLGSYAPSYSQLYNENLVAQMNDPSLSQQTPERQLAMAQKVAVPAAALDSVLPGMMERGAMGRMLHNVPGAVLVEGLTEGAQDALSQNAARDYDHRAWDKESIMNNAIMGGIGGGVMHAGMAQTQHSDAVVDPALADMYNKQMDSIKALGAGVRNKASSITDTLQQTPIAGAILQRARESASLPEGAVDTAKTMGYNAKQAVQTGMANADNAIRYSGSPSEFAQIMMGDMRPGYRSQRILRDDMGVPKRIRENPQQYAEYLQAHDANLLQGHFKDLTELSNDESMSPEVRAKAAAYASRPMQTLGDAKESADFVWKSTARKRSAEVFKAVNAANARFQAQQTVSGTKFNLEDAFAGARSKDPKIRERYDKMSNAMDKVLAKYLGADVVAQLADSGKLTGIRQGIVSLAHNLKAAEGTITERDAAVVAGVKKLLYTSPDGDPYEFANELDKAIDESGRTRSLYAALTRHTNASLDKAEDDNTHEGAFFLQMHPDGMASERFGGDEGLARLIDLYPESSESEQKIIHRQLSEEYGSEARANVVLAHYQRATPTYHDADTEAGETVEDDSDADNTEVDDNGEFTDAGVTSSEREYKSGVEGLTGQKMKLSGKKSGDSVANVRDYYVPHEKADLDADLAQLRAQDARERTRNGETDSNNRSVIQQITRTQHYTRMFDGNKEAAAAEMNKDIKHRFSELSDAITKMEREDLPSLRKRANELNAVPEAKRTEAQKKALAGTLATIKRLHEAQANPEAKAAQERRSDVIKSLRHQAEEIIKAQAPSVATNRAMRYDEAAKVLDNYAMTERSDTSTGFDDVSLSQMRLEKPYYDKNDEEGNKARKEINDHRKITAYHLNAEGEEYAVDYDAVKLIDSISDMEFTTTEHSNVLQRNEAKLKEAIGRLYERDDVARMEFPKGHIYLTSGDKPRFWKHGVRFVKYTKDKVTGQDIEYEVYEEQRKAQNKQKVRKEYLARLRERFKKAAEEKDVKTASEVKERMEAILLRSTRRNADGTFITREIKPRPESKSAAVREVMAQAKSTKYVQDLQNKIAAARKNEILFPDDMGVRAVREELEQKLAATPWGKRLETARKSMIGNAVPLGTRIGQYADLSDLESLADALDSVDPPVISNYLVTNGKDGKPNFAGVTVDEALQEERDPSEDANAGVQETEEQQGQKRAAVYDRLINMWEDRKILLDDMRTNPTKYDATQASVANLKQYKDAINSHIDAQIEYLKVAQQKAMDNNARRYNEETGLSNQQAFNGANPSVGFHPEAKGLPAPTLTEQKVELKNYAVPQSVTHNHALMFVHNYMQNRSFTFESALRYANLPVTDENVAALSQRVVGYLRNVAIINREANLKGDKNRSAYRIASRFSEKSIAALARDTADLTFALSETDAQNVVDRPQGPLKVVHHEDRNQAALRKELAKHAPLTINLSPKAKVDADVEAAAGDRLVNIKTDDSAKAAAYIAKRLQATKATSVFVTGADISVWNKNGRTQQDLNVFLARTLAEVGTLTNGQIDKIVVQGESGTSMAALRYGRDSQLKTIVHTHNTREMTRVDGSKAKVDEEFFHTYRGNDGDAAQHVDTAIPTDMPSLKERPELPQPSHIQQPKETLEAAKPELPLNGLNLDVEHAKREQAKWSKSNLIIAHGAKQSLTAAYQARLPSNRVNVGTYTAKDVVMVSVNGANVQGGEGVWAANLDKTKQELAKALASNATIVTDTTENRDRSYNTGEREIAKFLTDNNYQEVEPGVWKHASSGAVIDGFNNKKYSFLHPASPATIEYEGEIYPTVAHAYEAAKTTDRMIRKRITKTPTKQLYKLSSQLINNDSGTLDPTWKARRAAVIEALARKKFENQKALKRLLDTGSAALIHKNTAGDKFLGVGTDNVGQNVWGEVLTRIRAEERAKDLQNQKQMASQLANKPELPTQHLMGTDATQAKRRWAKATTYIGTAIDGGHIQNTVQTLGSTFANVSREYTPYDVAYVDQERLHTDEADVATQNKASAVTLARVMQAVERGAGIILPDGGFSLDPAVNDIESTLKGVLTHLNYIKNRDGVWQPSKSAEAARTKMHALGDFEGLVSTYTDLVNDVVNAIDNKSITKAADKRFAKAESALTAGLAFFNSTQQDEAAKNVSALLDTLALAKRNINVAQAGTPSTKVVTDMAKTASKGKNKTPTGKPSTKHGDSALVDKAMEYASTLGAAIKATEQDLRSAEHDLTEAVKEAARLNAEKDNAVLEAEIKELELQMKAATLQGSRRIKKAQTADERSRIALETQEEVARLGKIVEGKKKDVTKNNLIIKHNMESPTIPEAIKKATDLYGKEFSEATTEELTQAHDAIIRMRGKGVAISFAHELGARSFAMTDDMGNRIIKLAINGLSPLTQAHHEAMHDFISEIKKNPELKKVYNSLVLAASSPRIMYRLRTLLKESPQALEQIESDEEERIAYAFQFHSEGKLNLAKDTGVVTKIINFIRRVLGMLPLEERMVLVMDALHRGDLAEPSEVHAALKRMALSGDTESQLATFTKPLRWLANRLFMISIDQLHALEIPALSELADLFAPTPERETLDPRNRGFIQDRTRMHGRAMGELGLILEGTTAEERKAALNNLQSMRAPTTVLEKKIHTLLNDLHSTMLAAGVEQSTEAMINGQKTTVFTPIRYVKNYFPRVWKLHIDNKAPFIQQLLKDSKMTPAEAESVYNAVTSGDGLVDLAENESHIGFTPAMYAAKSRALTFINESNADKYVGYQSQDLVHIMTTYITQATHRAAYSHAFGSQGEHLRMLLDRAKEQGATQADLDRATEIIRGLEGTLGSNMNPFARSFTNFMITAQNLILLPLALLPSLLDPLGIAVRTGNLNDAWNAFARGIHGLFADMGLVEDQDKMRMSIGRVLGIVETQNVMDAMGYTHSSMFMGDTARNVNNRFFRWIGMSSWNNRMRAASMVAGMEYILANKNDAAKIRELGLQQGDVELVKGEDGNMRIAVQDNEFTGSQEDKLAKAQRMQAALFAWVDSTIIRPSAALRPTWMSDPRFLLIAHLKSFTYAFQNVIMRRAAAEADKGNYLPASVMMAYVPLQIGVDLTRGLLNGSLSHMNTAASALIGRGIMNSGVMGVAQFGSNAYGDLTHNGLFGQSFLGPTFDNAGTILGSMFGDGTAKEALIRSLPGGAAIRGWL